MTQYLKAIVAAIGMLATVVYAATRDKAISLDEAEGVWTAVLGVLTALGVYTVKNAP